MLDISAAFSLVKILETHDFFLRKSPAWKHAMTQHSTAAFLSQWRILENNSCSNSSSSSCSSE